MSYDRIQTVDRILNRCSWRRNPCAVKFRKNAFSQQIRKEGIDGGRGESVSRNLLENNFSYLANKGQISNAPEMTSSSQFFNKHHSRWNHLESFFLTDKKLGIFITWRNFPLLFFASLGGYSTPFPHHSQVYIGFPHPTLYFHIGSLFVK